MNNKRKALLFSTFLLFVIGGIFTAMPFIKSLGISAKSTTNLPRINVSSLKSNDYMFVEIDKSFKKDNNDGSTSYAPGTSWLVIKDHKRTFYVYKLPTWENSISLPYTRWYQFEGTCKNFGPTKINGNITSASLIQCNDENNEAYFRDHWYWTIQGKNTKNKLPELMSLPFAKEVNELVLYKS